MNRRLLLIPLLIATSVVHSQRLVTVETATELVTPAAFDAGPNDDVAVLDRASGVLRIGRWDGTTLNWSTTSVGISGADYLGVGALELPPGAGSMSIAATQVSIPGLAAERSLTSLGRTFWTFPYPST